jgi:hypothetical protein
VVVVLDYDSDGDPDFVIGSLNGTDRLLVNDGTGALTLIDTNVFGGRKTNGTLGVAFGDLNGDHRLDAVQAQGEQASDERVFVGHLIEPDSAPPVITGVTVIDGVV